MGFFFLHGKELPGPSFVSIMQKKKELGRQDSVTITSWPKNTEYSAKSHSAGCTSSALLWGGLSVFSQRWSGLSFVNSLSGKRMQENSDGLRVWSGERQKAEDELVRTDLVISSRIVWWKWPHSVDLRRHQCGYVCSLWAHNRPCHCVHPLYARVMLFLQQQRSWTRGVNSVRVEGGLGTAGVDEGHWKWK